MPFNITFRTSIWLVSLSAVLYAVALINAWFLLSLISLAPLFAAIQEAGAAAAFKRGLLFGGILSCCCLSWMITIVPHFTHKGTGIGIAAFLLAALLLALYFGLILFCFAAIKGKKNTVISNALLMAALWTAGEWLIYTLAPGMPWFALFRASNGVLNNLYAIQPGEAGGVILLGFFVVLFNYTLGAGITSPNRKLLLLPAGILVLYMSWGYWLLHSYRSRPVDAGRRLRVALVCAQLTPDDKWDSLSGPFLVKKILAQNRFALDQQPDVVLWPEAIVPWSYRADDDFLKEVLQPTAATAPQAIHVLGMTTGFSGTAVYNSAYCLRADGQVLGRYDKRFPLSLVEQPLAFGDLLTNPERFAEKPGNNTTPIRTPSGALALFICNDITVPVAAIEPVRAGATFLFSLNNDAWISDNAFLTGQHFLSARLRAVEVRRDLAINSNLGSSAIAGADGVIHPVAAADESNAKVAEMTPGTKMTVYARYPHAGIIADAILIVLFLAAKVSKAGRRKEAQA